MLGTIKVKCASTIKVCNLSKEDESNTAEDLCPGAGLLCDAKGKTYPIEVVIFQGKNKNAHMSVAMFQVIPSGQDKKLAACKHAGWDLKSKLCM